MMHRKSFTYFSYFLSTETELAAVYLQKTQNLTAHHNIVDPTTLSGQTFPKYKCMVINFGVAQITRPGH